MTHGTDRSQVELTREDFDDLTAGRLEVTIMATKKVLDHAREKGRDKIDRILLVGGSTYMPQVQARLEKEFPAVPDIRLLDPNQAVAKGAAVFAYKCHLDDEVKKKVAEQTGTEVSAVAELPSEVREQAEASVAADEGLQLAQMQNLTRKTIQNVTSKSFGLVTHDPASRTEYVDNLIVADEKVPTEITKQYSTVSAGQRAVKVTCMENILRQKGRVDLEACSEIGEAELRFARPLPQGSPVEMRFSLSADGLLAVYGKDLTTGSEVELSIDTAAVLSAGEIEKKKNLSEAIAVS